MISAYIFETRIIRWLCVQRGLGIMKRLEDVWGWFYKGINPPKEISYFLSLYTWESVLFCFIAPFFLAIPIMLVFLSLSLNFFICFIIILVALLLSIPWLLIPYWIVKTMSRSRHRLITWVICNGVIVIGYAFLFTT